MLELKVGDYIQNNDDPDIIIQIIEIEDSSSIKITPFNKKCADAVMRRYVTSAYTAILPSSFVLGGEYWMYINEVKLNYRLLLNFRTITKFNEDLKELINE